MFALMMSYSTPSQKKFQDAYEFLNGLHLFNKKNFICWTKLKTEKLLATAKQRIRKNTVWKMRQFFSQSEHRDRLHTISHWSLSFFVCFLRTPLLHNKPYIKDSWRINIKKYKEEMEGVYNSASVFMHHLNIKIDS